MLVVFSSVHLSISTSERSKQILLEWSQYWVSLTAYLSNCLHSVRAQQGHSLQHHCHCVTPALSKPLSKTATSGILVSSPSVFDRMAESVMTIAVQFLLPGLKQFSVAVQAFLFSIFNADFPLTFTVFHGIWFFLVPCSYRT